MYLLIKPESFLCGHLVVHFASQGDLVACQPHFPCLAVLACLLFLLGLCLSVSFLSLCSMTGISRCSQNDAVFDGVIFTAVTRGLMSVGECTCS